MPVFTVTPSKVEIEITYNQESVRLYTVSAKLHCNSLAKIKECVAFSYDILRQITQFLMKANSHHPGVNNILTEQSMREQSPIAKKIWLSIHPRNFGSCMTVNQFDCPSVHTTGKPM